MDHLARWLPPVLQEVKKGDWASRQFLTRVILFLCKENCHVWTGSKNTKIIAPIKDRMPQGYSGLVHLVGNTFVTQAG